MEVLLVLLCCVTNVFFKSVSTQDCALNHAKMYKGRQKTEGWLERKANRSSAFIISADSGANSAPAKRKKKTAKVK